MGQEFIIYSDLHIGAPNEIPCTFHFTKNTVLLGDNFEIKNSKIDELDKIILLRDNTRKKCLKKGGIYLSGNHSVQMKDLSYKRGNVLFTHGDFVHYGEEKAKKVRSIKKGKSFLYWILLAFIRIFYESRANPLKAEYLQRAYTLAKEKNAKVLVMGHFHPTSIVDISYRGIRIIVVPRGKTKLIL